MSQSQMAQADPALSVPCISINMSILIKWAPVWSRSLDPNRNRIEVDSVDFWIPQLFAGPSSRRLSQNSSHCFPLTSVRLSSMGTITV